MSEVRGSITEVLTKLGLGVVCLNCGTRLREWTDNCSCDKAFYDTQREESQ